MFAYFDSKDREKPKKPHVTNYQLFNDDIKITRTETTARAAFSDYINSITFKFDIKKPGDYIFEGWVAKYRSRDTKEEEWKYCIKKPTIVTEKPKSLVYRIEGTRLLNGKIDKDSVTLDNYVGISKQIITRGDQHY